MNLKILSESRFDFKYKQILSRIDHIEIIEGKYFQLLKLLISNNSIYHIRYITYRGKVITFLRLIIVYLASKISNSKIIWTCHNIYEHNIPSKKYNDFIRLILCNISSHILVFHKDLIPHLPSNAKKKISVASFGNFKLFIENQKNENIDFQEKYKKWLQKLQIKKPLLVSISAAKRNNIEKFITNIGKDKLPTLIIAPNRELKIKFDNPNIFYYSEGFVKSEVTNILNQSELIGIIGHQNISVPTSIYMFASFGIPIIGLDHQPVNSIIRKNEIGVVWDDTKTLKESINEIIQNYQLFQTNCHKFLKKYNWENSAAIHKAAFEI